MLGGVGAGELADHALEVVGGLGVVALVVVAAHVDQADLVQRDTAHPAL